MKEIINKLRLHNLLANDSEEIYLQIFDDESCDLLLMCNDSEVEAFTDSVELVEYLDAEIATFCKNNQPNATASE